MCIRDSYGRNWIASKQPVASPRFASDQTGHGSNVSGEQNGKSGLYVIVAEDYDFVLQPVDELSSTLFWLAIYASLFFVVIALLMWLFVLRMLRETNNRLMRSFSAADSTFRGSAESS